MDPSTLAVKMLEWETTQRAADALRAEIEAAVLEVGKTQTVGNVRATYSAGRKSYDYEAVVRAGMASNDPAEAETWWNVKDENTQRIEKIDWKAVCDTMRVTMDDIPLKSQSEPSVTLKLLA